MNYINITNTNNFGVSKTYKYKHTYQNPNIGALFYMLKFYLHLCGNNPLPKYSESREAHIKWYLDKINEFQNSLFFEKRGDKYRYSITIKNSKQYSGRPLYISSGSDVVISTPYFSLEEGTKLDLFDFEMNLMDPKFYTDNSYSFDINIDDWTFKEERMIYKILLKYVNVRIALPTLLNDYIRLLRKMIGELKNKKISKKLMNELSSVDLKQIQKYRKIENYCKCLNDVCGAKGEEFATYANTTEFFHFLSPYKKLIEFFIKRISQEIMVKYVEIILTNGSGKLEVEAEMIRYIIDNHGEELTDEFLKILN